ncbi:MAG TPA: SDR family NAD(P)-dependent oxidoreductase, partial [Methylomirabilota bacterium]|nr:SDR family NAD(P)-dependent oxidoreductase [Methylomirabilota bacterium]
MGAPKWPPSPPDVRGAPAKPCRPSTRRCDRRCDMDLGLRGKVALVTAASKGMGRACALGLAAEGARVAMCARNETELKAAAEDVRART